MEATIEDILEMVHDIDPSLHVGAHIGVDRPYMTFVGHTAAGRPVSFEISLRHAGRPACWWRAVISMKWRCLSGRRFG